MSELAEKKNWPLFVAIGVGILLWMLKFTFPGTIGCLFENGTEYQSFEEGEVILHIYTELDCSCDSTWYLRMQEGVLYEGEDVTEYQK